MLQANICEQFSTGYGGRKVSAGEYELYKTLDASQAVTWSENEVLTPGLIITIAIIIGQYEAERLDRSQRPGCMSDKVLQHDRGDITW